MLLFLSKPKLTTITSGPINKQIHKRMYIKLKTNLYCQYLTAKEFSFCLLRFSFLELKKMIRRIANEK